MFVSLALEVKSRSFLLVNANNSLPVSLATTVKTNLEELNQGVLSKSSMCPIPKGKALLSNEK